MTGGSLEGIMRARYDFQVRDTIPRTSAVLRAQGIPVGVDPGSRIMDLVDSATERYGSLASPRAVVEEIALPAFDDVYRGEGRNELSTPLQELYPKADALALFAVTLGPEISREISDAFSTQDFAFGAILDAVASEGADLAVTLTARQLLADLLNAGRVTSPATVLPYSPGYCGWHITAQRMLFSALQPEEIGITLRPSCLMDPLKSVTGVLAFGDGGIHDFDDDFDFCEECATHECRGRIPLSGSAEGDS